MKQNSRRFLAILLAIVIAIGMPQMVVSAEEIPEAQAENAIGLGVQKHTEEDVVAYLKNSNATIADRVEYLEEPVCTPPYNPGKLCVGTRNNAIAMLNNVRYIAGLQPVVWDESQTEIQQAASIVSAGNGGIDHYPSQPAGMDIELFKKGELGCGMANLGAGYTTLNKGIVHGWMNDGDAGNIDRVGHRRWCLNPAMGKTAMGAVTNSETGDGRYYSMYAWDESNTQATETRVAWPAQAMPLEYFGDTYPWSISIGKNVPINDVSVKLVRQSDKKTWNFSSTAADGYFNVNNDNYGQTGCIIFRPDDVSYADGDVFQVTITGLTEQIQYTVSFFELDKYWHVHDYSKISGSMYDDCSKFSVTYTCKCGDSYVKEHEVISTSIVKEPTCENTGEMQYTCKLDNGGTLSTKRTIPALGHDVGATVSEVVNGAVTGTCSRCHQDVQVGVILSFTSMWKNAALGGAYTSVYNGSCEVGESVLYKMNYFEHEQGYGVYDDRFVVESSDPAVVSVIPRTNYEGKIEFLKEGTATITIYPLLNPNVKRTQTFNVGKSISNCSISLKTTNYIYDGYEKKPEVVIKDGTATLVNGTDYTVTYANNINVGTATVTITGKGKYVGTASTTFKISKAAQKLITSISSDSFAPGQTAKITSEANGAISYKSSNPSVATVSNTGVVTGVEPGTATITVSAAATSNYNAATAEIKVTVTNPVDDKKAISSCAIELKTTGYTYDGIEKRPDVIVKDGNTTLVNGVDYEVAYTNNINAGTSATVTITGKDRYIGSAAKTFTINKANQIVTTNVPSLTLNVGKTAAVIGYGKGTVSYKSGNPSVATVSNTGIVTGVAPGTAIITVSAAGTNNYNAGTATVTLTVKDATEEIKEMASCTIELEQTSYTYDGTEKRPKVVVKDGNTTLIEGTHYGVVYTDNVRAGKAYVSVTAMKGYTGSVRKEFTIKKADQELKPSVNSLMLKVGERVTISGYAHGTISFRSDNQNVAMVNSKGEITGVAPGTANIILTASATLDYNVATAEVKVTVMNPEPVKKPMSTCSIALKSSDYIYDGIAKKPEVTVKDGNNLLVNGTDYSVTYSNNINAGTSAKVIVTGKGLYEGKVEKTFSIMPKGISGVTASLSTTKYTYDSSKVRTPSVTVKDGSKLLVKNTDYTVVYASGRKSMGRYAVTVRFKGNYTGSKPLYFTIGPKNPTTVSVSLYGYDDALVKWSKVSGATGYAVYYRKSTWSSYTRLGYTTGTSFKKANLADGSKYYFKVYAYRRVGGNNCYSVGGKTSSGIYALKRVSTPRVSRYGTKIKVRWSNIYGESGYQISRSTSKTGTYIASTYKTTSGNYRYISAAKGKYYYYKVRAYRQVGTKKIYGPWSTAVRYKR